MRELSHKTGKVLDDLPVIVTHLGKPKAVVMEYRKGLERELLELSRVIKEEGD